MTGGPDVRISSRPDTAAIRTVRAATAAPDRRLLVCPAAGSGATGLGPFVAAQPGPTDVLAVQYPGRGDRRDTPASRDAAALARDVAAELAPWAADPLPLVVLGHSYGAVIAFEVTRSLAAAGTAPAALVVSGRRSPSDGMGVPAPRDDDDVLAELERIGAATPEVLARAPMRKFLAAQLRDDFHANAGYRVPPDVTVPVPVTFLHADRDPYVDADGARRWAGHTTGRFHAVFLPGGHGFLDDDPDAAVAALP